MDFFNGLCGLLQHIAWTSDSGILKYFDVILAHTDQNYDYNKNSAFFHDFICLQMNTFCVVSDSGTLPEESSFFTSVGHSFPAVCIRTSTERLEALDKGDFILAGIDKDHLLQAVDVAVEMNKNNDLGIPVPDYVDENVSDKVVKIIQSYTGVVDKMVWRKY